jgi:hypothetical protein
MQRRTPSGRRQRGPLEEDLKPWYRQFWPWFLIALPGSVVIAAFATLYIANRHADDLVVDEYYKDGLAINRQLERKQRAVQQGISASVYIDGDSAVVTTTGSVAAQALELRFSHPLEADRDFSTTVEDYGSGIYRGNLPMSVAPRWHWVLEGGGNDGWRIDGTLSTTDLRNGPR